MKKIIKNKEEQYRTKKTPEWFCLSIYEGLKDASREDLACFIIDRILLFSDLQKLNARENNQEREDKMKKILEHFYFNLELRSAPEVFSEMTKAIYPKKSSHTDFSDFGGYSKIVKSAYNSLIEQNLRKDEDMLQELTVNLFYSDEKVIEDFTAWLNLKRLPNKKARRLSEEAIRNEKGIIEDKVIPCMDLIFWFKYNNENYTQAKLGDLLYPLQDVDRASKVRKTTLKKVERLLGGDSFASIL